MTSNFQRSYWYRNAVVLHMQEQGLHSAASVQVEPSPNSRPTGLTHGDISGIPGWTVGVRSQLGLDLSTAQREVSREAELDGSGLYVSIQKRIGHPIEESYCTMPLHVWLSVIDQLNPSLRSQVAPELAVPG